MADALKKLALALVALLPAGGLWQWWEQARARPAAAALLTVLYEAAVLLVAFGRKVWKDELERDAVKASADWVRGTLRGFAPGFRRRYKRVVLDEHGGFNVRGLGLINTYRLRLEQVFVELRIDPTNPQRFNRNLAAPKHLAGNRPVWDFLRDTEAGAGARSLAVIGPPGCGKTTLLRHVALTLAANRQRRQRVRAYAPVLLFLRDHTAAVTRPDPPPLGRLLQDYFGDGGAFAGLKPPAGWFEKQLKAGKCLVLLDGLDEVAEVSQRRAVSAWVDTQIRTYPRARFVLTARPQGYTDAPLERADVVLEVQPFDAAQVWCFVENWYLANEAMSSGGRVDAGVRRRALDEAKDLMRRLRAVPALSALTVNPLLLTMIAMVHRYRGALPGSRVGLYSSICEVLLERWRQVRGIRDRYDLKAEQKLVVLRPLAAHMMESRLRDIKTEDALPVITPPLERVGVPPEDAADFLTNLQDTSGLMVERESGLWSFAHLTFQEYLTAAHWLERKGADADWRALVGDAWWHETLRLYAAQGDATPLVRACLEVNTVPALSLAADFLEENRELDPELRRATEARLIDDLESDDPARRRFAAEVRLARRLKSLQQIDDRREIDLKFVTCAEYQLFLDDVRAQKEHRQPDHWADTKFPEGAAGRPVSGVRAEDAAAFCEWLTRRQGGDLYFRLPRADEAREFPAEATNLAAWCHDGDEFRVAGLTPAEEQEIRQQLGGVSELPLPSILERALDLALPRGPSLARATGFEVDFPRDHSFPRGRLRDLPQAVGLARALDLSLTLPRGRVLDLARALALDLTDARSFALARDLALDVSISHLFARDLSVDINNTATTRARGLNAARERARTLAYALDPELARQLEDNRKESVAADQVVRYVLRASDICKRRRAVLIDDLLLSAGAPTYPAWRQARRGYAAHILKFAYYGNEEADTNPLTRWGRLLGIHRDDADEEERQQAVLNFYWWVRIVWARELGRLPAWEGIRVVRERVSEAEGADKRG